jgi:hypothetical protein
MKPGAIRAFFWSNEMVCLLLDFIDFFEVKRTLVQIPLPSMSLSKTILSLFVAVGMFTNSISSFASAYADAPKSTPRVSTRIHVRKSTLVAKSSSSSKSYASSSHSIARKPSSSSSSKSNSSVASFSSPSSTTVTHCTDAAWSCVVLRICRDNGMYDNLCSLKDRNCLGSQSVKPPSSIPCASSSSTSSLDSDDNSASSASASFSSISRSSDITAKNMKRNLAAWAEARKALVVKEEDMSHQPQGAGCMRTLAAIDSDWVMNYNNYVSISNNLLNGGNWLPGIQTAEQQMTDVIERIRLAPTFCY